MAIFFTLFYLFTAYMSPETLFGGLAEYHIEILIAVLAFVISAFLSRDSQLFKVPQTYALLVFIVAVALSLIGQRLFGLSIDALRDFVPNAFAFFVIVLACKKRLHLQLVVATLFIVCVYIILKGYMAVRADDVLSPYLLLQTNGGEIYVLRIRGLSFLNDPNDFAQLLVSLLPCLFFFRRPESAIRNLFLVYLPAAFLIFGMFLTHSRGAILALLAVIVVAARPRLGNIRSAIIAGVLFVASSAVGWSGGAGRDISAEGGADRMDAWSVGLTLIRSHPIFGVGYKRFAEFNSITAHNSIIVCAAEVGLFGFFFWVMLILVSLRDTALLGAVPKTVMAEEEPDGPHPAYRLRTKDTIAKAATVESIAASTAVAAPVPYYALSLEEEREVLPEAEVRRLARIVNLALVGFLAASYFLSRSYVMTLYIYVGFAVVVYRMGLDQGFAPPRMPAKRILLLTLIVSAALIALVYAILRIQHMLPH